MNKKNKITVEKFHCVIKHKLLFSSFMLSRSFRQIERKMLLLSLRDDKLCKGYQKTNEQSLLLLLLSWFLKNFGKWGQQLKDQSLLLFSCCWCQENLHDCFLLILWSSDYLQYFTKSKTSGCSRKRQFITSTREQEPLEKPAVPWPRSTATMTKLFFCNDIPDGTTSGIFDFRGAT